MPHRPLFGVVSPGRILYAVLGRPKKSAKSILEAKVEKPPIFARGIDFAAKSFDRRAGSHNCEELQRESRENSTGPLPRECVAPEFRDCALAAIRTLVRVRNFPGFKILFGEPDVQISRD